jgi:hypothetical protein
MIRSSGLLTGMRITVPCPARTALVLAYGVTIRDKGHREHVSGQADLYDEPRARVVSWPRMRKAQPCSKRLSRRAGRVRAPVSKGRNRARIVRCSLNAVFRARRTCRTPHTIRNGACTCRSAKDCSAGKHPIGTEGAMTFSKDLAEKLAAHPILSLGAARPYRNEKS